MRSLYYLALSIFIAFTVVSCGGGGQTVDIDANLVDALQPPDAPIEIDAPDIDAPPPPPAYCDYVESQDATNNDFSQAVNTGITALATDNNHLCGTSEGGDIDYLRFTIDEEWSPRISVFVRNDNSWNRPVISLSRVGGGNLQNVVRRHQRQYTTLTAHTGL